MDRNQTTIKIEKSKIKFKQIGGTFRNLPLKELHLSPVISPPARKIKKGITTELSPMTSPSARKLKRGMTS